MNKILKNDQVIVVTGKDKGRSGSVTQVLSNGKLLIQGMNIAKKHQKGNPQAGIPGGIIEKEMPMDASNVMLRKSIAGFKIRDNWPIGCKVNLRRNHMYEFLDRLINISIPRVRDFRGMNPRSFDGRGNYSMGFNEQIIFPEIDYDKIDKLRGLDIAITTTAKTDEEGRALLEAFNFPFKK